MRLIREPSGISCTFGVLFTDSYFECFTLENTAKIIPSGTYGITLYDSPHNKRIVPLLIGVPGREEIEIHIANYPHELEGCIAVGQSIGVDVIHQSTKAFLALMEKVANGDEIRIEDPL